MSASRWMDKGEVVYVYTREYYSAIKRNEIMPFATTWMDLEGIILSEIRSQMEKDKILSGVTYMCNLKNTTNFVVV